MRHWLFKSEPAAYSYDDLVAEGVGCWDGVRNYQARNMLRDDIKPGDRVLFYHSKTAEVGVVGTAVVMREGYPDHTAQDPSSAHPDPKSTPDNPIWFMVDIKADRRFARTVGLDELRANPATAGMATLRRGNRLSITPVTQEEFTAVERMGA
jgi:predicted RNA-binding protein with PUA-like domain